MSRKVKSQSRYSTVYHTNEECRNYPDHPVEYGGHKLDECQYCKWLNRDGKDHNGMDPDAAKEMSSDNAWSGHRKSILEQYGYEVSD